MSCRKCGRIKANQDLLRRYKPKHIDAGTLRELRIRSLKDSITLSKKMINERNSPAFWRLILKDNEELLRLERRE